MKEFVIISFGIGNLENVPGDLVNRWNKSKVTWDNLQEFLDFTTNDHLDYMISHGAAIEYSITTWHYRKQDKFDLNAVNENFIFDESASYSHDYVSEFLDMARSSENPADYYYDRDICTNWLYDEEEDEWYENEENPCRCDKCLEEDQRLMEEYEKGMIDLEED